MKSEFRRRLLVVDDDAALRGLVQQIAAPALDVDVLDAETAAVAIGILATNAINVILTDVQMPGMDGLEFVKHIKAKGLKVPVIFFSGFTDKNMALQAIKVGAFDFIEKPFVRETLLSAVQRALSQYEQSTTAKLQRFGLNSTQLKVLELLMVGRSNKDIAALVHLSEPSIKYHVGCLLEKFGTENRADLRQKLYIMID